MFRGLLLHNAVYNTAYMKWSLYLILSIECLENHKDVYIRNRFVDALLVSWGCHDRSP